MLQRLALRELVEWKRRTARKPLLIDGARQVGKSWLVAEHLPSAFVCASGSNIGLLGSFPVGKVEQLELFPLCFEEFVMAAQREHGFGATNRHMDGT